jgi:hypothetical protein
VFNDNQVNNNRDNEVNTDNIPKSFGVNKNVNTGISKNAISLLTTSPVK